MGGRFGGPPRVLKATSTDADVAAMTARSSNPLKIALAVFLVVAIAATGALLLLRNSGGSGSDDRIWKLGDTWTITVQQRGATVSPDAPKDELTELAYRFRVAAAPEGGDGLWRIDVKQDGASGPFADGWRLYFREAKDGAMRLSEVAQGAQKAAAAEVASIVLGVSFPYETKYTAPPKDDTVQETALIARSSTPPPIGDGRVGSDTTVTSGGGVPPKDAPVVPAGQAPPGAPQG